MFDGKYPRLFSAELFEAVQTAFKAHNHSRQQKRNFAFSGLLTCGECGCAITSEIKKGKYVYYHCTHRKGPCSQVKAVREEELDRQFGEIVFGISIGPEVVEWVKQALKISAEEAKQFQKETLQQLTQQADTLEKRLEKGFEARLDGKVPEDLWQRKSGEWQAELQVVREKIQNHRNAQHTYYEQGIALLELAQRAYLLYQKRDRAERRALLQVLCSNSTLKDGIITATYRQPFDSLAVGKKALDAAPDEEAAKTKVLEKWWSQGDSFRTFLNGIQQENTVLFENFKELAGTFLA